MFWRQLWVLILWVCRYDGGIFYFNHVMYVVTNTSESRFRIMFHVWPTLYNSGLFTVLFTVTLYVDNIVRGACFFMLICALGMLANLA